MALYNTTTKKEFQEKVLESDRLVLVDFWADWCPPCHAMAPILENASSDIDGFDVVKVDIEASADNQSLAGEYEVRSIPNMIVFKNGAVVKTLIGARPQSVLEQEITALA